MPTRRDLPDRAPGTPCRVSWQISGLRMGFIVISIKQLGTANTGNRWKRCSCFGFSRIPPAISRSSPLSPWNQRASLLRTTVPWVRTFLITIQHTDGGLHLTAALLDEIEGFCYWSVESNHGAPCPAPFVLAPGNDFQPLCPATGVHSACAVGIRCFALQRFVRDTVQLPVRFLAPILPSLKERMHTQSHQVILSEYR